MSDPLREDADRPWEWSAERIRNFGYRVVDEVVYHLTDLPDRPVFRPFPQELAERYLEFGPAPESGESEEQILAAFRSDIGPFPFGNGHPRFYGWVNSPPCPIGVFAELLSAAMNPSCAGGNHAAVYVERQVINWFKHLLGFPEESMGLLVSGGSMAALTALAVARQAHCGYDMRTEGLAGHSARLRFYRTAEGHGCHQKAIELMGIGSQNLRVVEQDCSRRMIPSDLDAVIRDDRDRGFVPVAVIASAGTVNTGAIDPLDEIAGVCAAHRVWLHVDGAYGAPAILTERYGKELSALSRADSVALDPHKWLSIPVETGLILIRNAAQMRATFSLVPAYLQTDGNQQGVGGLPWFSEYGFQQTRAFRALKVWMALRHYGLSGYRQSIERDLQLANRLANALGAAEHFEIFEPQSLSIVCFRYSPPDLRQDARKTDGLNRAILERIQLGGKAFLSSTVLDGQFWMRACIVNHRASGADIDQLVDAIREAANRGSQAP